MDHIGEDTLAGIPPDLISDGRDDSSARDIPQASATPDIDVPFTPSAQRVVARCVELAELVGGGAVLTEHLLLAIASTPECAAAKLISEQEHSSEATIAALKSMLGTDNRATSDRRASPRLERIVIRAKREAFRHRHREVSTLHLLMALIRERADLAPFGLERPGAGFQKFASTAARGGESD